MSDEDDEEEITADTLRCKPRALPISAQAAFGYVPPRRQDPKEHSYYYRQAKYFFSLAILRQGSFPSMTVFLRRRQDIIRNCTEMTENTPKAWDFMLMRRSGRGQSEC
ncbi:hypothetical protein HJG60_001864 [Phyllostomus discolor]|uniref:Uncharacterized protein n=1 Tax=Phyllostomus discolor TaxID=89673 RepID=A0A834B928_9CHIR|nr:hypothetical protein HJG60_001864 [Phyllostomus discolor]